MTKKKKNLNWLGWLVAMLIFSAWIIALFQFFGPTLLAPLRAVSIPKPIWWAAGLTVCIVTLGIIALIVRLLFHRNPDWQLQVYQRQRQRQGESRDTVIIGGGDFAYGVSRKTDPSADIAQVEPLRNLIDNSTSSFVVVSRDETRLKKPKFCNDNGILALFPVPSGLKRLSMAVDQLKSMAPEAKETFNKLSKSWRRPTLGVTLLGFNPFAGGVTSPATLLAWGEWLKAPAPATNFLFIATDPPPQQRREPDESDPNGAVAVPEEEPPDFINALPLPEPPEPPDGNGHHLEFSGFGGVGTETLIRAPVLASGRQTQPRQPDEPSRLEDLAKIIAERDKQGVQFVVLVPNLASNPEAYRSTDVNVVDLMYIMRAINVEPAGTNEFHKAARQIGLAAAFTIVGPIRSGQFNLQENLEALVVGSVPSSAPLIAWRGIQRRMMGFYIGPTRQYDALATSLPDYLKPKTFYPMAHLEEEMSEGILYLMVELADEEVNQVFPGIVETEGWRQHKVYLERLWRTIEGNGSARATREGGRR